MPSKYLSEIEEILSKLTPQIPKGKSESYVGGGLQFVGLKVPQINKVFAEGFSFSSLKENELAQIWNDIWFETKHFEVRSLALSWFESRRKKDNFHRHWPRLKKFSAKIDNWAHSDSLSSFYAQFLERDPEAVKKVLDLWSRSKNFWLRRQSIVSLLYYSSARKKWLPSQELLARVEKHLEDEAYYVQKGVGWALREIGNLYPEATFRFLKKNILRLSPQAFTAATEKLKGLKKQELKELRKARPSKMKNRRG